MGHDFFFFFFSKKIFKKKFPKKIFKNFGLGVLYIMAWVVCLLMGMGGLVEWEGWVDCLLMGMGGLLVIIHDSIYG